MPDLSDLTAQCIRCGFCLEACPTFQLTADESQSPRGRITLARTATETGEWKPDTQTALDSCLGCRACETACPSGVQYGKIIELAREQTNDLQPRQNKARKNLLNATTNPLLSQLQFFLGSALPTKTIPAPLSNLISGQPPEAATPTPQDLPTLPPHDPKSLPEVKGEVYLLEGCVMRILYPDVHLATRRLLRRVGFTVRETNSGCCGALHAHAGYLPEAEEHAQNLATNFSENLPVIVNSAGCGSTLKEYGSVIGQGQERLAKHTFDLTEFLLQNGLLEQLKTAPGLPNVTVTYHDACHLAHGQKIRQQPRDLIQAIPGVTLTELPEAEMCCGSAGTYNLFQPQMARQLLDRKWANVESTRAHLVASGNPGCHAWINQAAQETNSPIKVVHTGTLLESAFTRELID